MRILLSKQVGKAIAGVAVIGIVVGLLLAGVHFFGQSPTPDSSGVGSVSEELVYVNGNWYGLRSDVETLLLVGLDKNEDEGITNGTVNHRQSDALVLLIMDKTNRICRVLPLNRDTMVSNNVLGLAGNVVAERTEQLALAHTYGSGKQDSARNVCQSVSKLLYGVSIDHYVTMTMDGINLLNDAVGGVEVLIEDDFSSVTDQLPMGQKVTLQGELAEIYIRSRKSMTDPTNINRMKRQKAFMEGLFDKMQMMSKNDDSFALSTLTEMSDAILSDCSIQKLEKFYDTLSEYELEILDPPAGELKVGEEFYEFYTDDVALQSMVMEYFFEVRKAPEGMDEEA